MAGQVGWRLALAVSGWRFPLRGGVGGRGPGGSYAGAVARTALVLGASGQIGAAVVPALLADGWQVRAGARNPHQWPVDAQGVVVDRADDASLAAAVSSGVDVLVDCVAYDATHAEQLLALAGDVGSAVVVSSLAVYADSDGRTLDEATGVEDFPELPVPIPESQPTVAAGPATYATRKAALEETLLGAAGTLPSTVLRPGAITGLNSVHPRELFFVQRVLDDRPVQVLAHGGRSRFHTSSTANIAELVRLAAGRPGTRVLNAVDPQALTTAQIGAAVAAAMGASPRQVLLAGPPRDGVGDSPWAVPRPFVADMTAAGEELGYEALGGYADHLPATVEWIVDAVRGRDWREVFPTFLRANGPDAFDYAAEDAWLRAAPES